MDIEKIRVLPDGVANQIAAGEVVGRPASVVKELLENAVDAGSTSVTVNFKEGGRALIQVVDNGCGMNEPDARMAFERHATSKIASVEDLSRLHSFGFRGEALPSIASVAEVELRTRTASAEVGTRVTINGGAFVAQEPVQTPVGTQFLVKNLFFNVPARRRFLKEPTVEARHLTSEFQRVALCHPEIEFTLYNNDTLVYSLPPGNLRQRIAGICGKGLANNLLDVAVETSIVKIEGYVGHPSVAKKTNREQYLFVNGRYFRSPYFHKAVLQAYEKLIAPETQPPYFLYLTVAPERIDVNVHPQKTEVKFEDEQAIWQIFNAAVRESLGKLGVVPLMDFEIDSSIDIPVYREGTVYREPEIGVNPDFNPFRTDTVKEKVHKMPAGGGVSPRTAPLDGWQNLYEIDSRAGDAGLADRFDEMDSALQAFLEGEPEPVQQSLELGGTAGFCGQLKLSDRLYATTLGDALAVVDVGRARERVLFERYLRLLGNNATVSQQLLFPERIELSPADGRLMAEIREELSSSSGAITAVTGKKVELFRPPYGDYDNLLIDTSNSMGLYPIQWDVDSLDWKNISAEDMVRRCTKAVNPGDIVLFHNDSKYILQALPQILEYYQQAGYRIIPISELLLEGDTWIDHAGTQHLATPAPSAAEKETDIESKKIEQ